MSNERQRMVGEATIPIYYEDTDLSGFVYHANYLKYFERAREQLIGRQFLVKLWDQKIHFVVSSAQLKYRKPVRHGDSLVVVSDIGYSRSPLLPCIHNGYLIRSDGQCTLAVSGEVSLVTLNAENKPIRLPDFVIDRFSSTVEIEQQSNGV